MLIRQVIKRKIKKQIQMRREFMVFAEIAMLSILNVRAQSSVSTDSLNQVKNDDKYVESDVVPLAGKSGFAFRTRAGDFLFKPYALVQTYAVMNYYDDDGISLSDQDNIENSGFCIPNAILGFSGKAFGKMSFNLALNAAKSGNALLQQSWFDINMNEAFRLRAGKFKTPMHSAYLTTLGQTLFPCLPFSLTAPVNVYESLNAVNPSMSTGFDTGLMLHGLLGHKWDYRFGVFNGTGINVNTATKTMSDDHKWLPSLLYSVRLAYMPLGDVPTHQGSPDDLHNNKILFAISSSYNVEAEDESSNDYRGGLEFAWLYRRLFFSSEGYMLRMNWQKRMQGLSDKTFWGAYAQGGYFVSDKLQFVARYDFYDRNGTGIDGIMDMPAVGFNYFVANSNLKLQAMYQYLGKYGHNTQLDRDNDDMDLPLDMVMVLLQYSF